MARTSALVAVVLIVSGCIGATSRSAFETEVRSRGAGITGEQLSASADIVAAEVAVDDGDDLEILELRVDGIERNVVFLARRGDNPDFVDQVGVRSGELLGASPMQNLETSGLDEAVIALADIPLAQMEDIVDRAIAAFGDADALVETLQVGRVGGDPFITIVLESPRQTGVVVFDLDGTVVSGGQEES